ncbi:Gfo/Idh/MocA family protein [Microbispora sp. H10885]|uniref:Gfo/Idh/MocA family protein n=1 Tax=Microbispora sp. H10885 TaxID=2729110 RepID=UPI00160279BA|nr:Gfo/Idh/MocA family oxidoreductase [Microbispora sp. H10885]
MTRPLRVAVVGLGWAGSVHTRVLRSLEGVTLVAVADIDPARRAAFDGVPAVSSLEELLELELDYCVVATPTAEHEPMGLALAEAGVPALIEKPLGASLPAAMRLVKAFEDAGLIAAVGHTERRNPAVRELGLRLRAGEFGAVYQVVTRRHSPFPGRVRDVGVVTDIAIHDVDLTMWLTGSQITSVAGNVRCLEGRAHEDLAIAAMRLSGGEIANLQVSRISPYKERMVAVHTAQGWVTADALTRTLTHYAHGEPTVSAPGKVTSYEVPGAEPYQSQHEAFRDALLGLPNDIVTLREGAAAVAATEAILSAAHTGACVTPTDHLLTRR